MGEFEVFSTKPGMKLSTDCVHCHGAPSGGTITQTLPTLSTKATNLMSNQSLMMQRKNFMSRAPENLPVTFATA